MTNAENIPNKCTAGDAAAGIDSISSNNKMYKNKHTAIYTHSQTGQNVTYSNDSKNVDKRKAQTGH
jgi:hypothetical protein